MNVNSSISSDIKGLLIDLSGTIHIEDEPTIGAIDAIRRLSQTDIPFLFVSNTSKESCDHIVDRLRRAGFDHSLIPKEKIFTSLTAAASYINKDSSVNKVYPLVSDSSLTELPSNLIQKEHDYSQNVVLVGLAPSLFSYDNINYAFQILTREGASLIAMNKGRYHQTSDGLSLGPGPFVEALEFASSKTAHVIGKPSKSFFQQAADCIGCTLEECAMIGDDVKDDVMGAVNAGVRLGVLVKTGKFRDSDVAQLQSYQNRDDGNGQAIIVDSFAVFVDEFLSHRL